MMQKTKMIIIFLVILLTAQLFFILPAEAVERKITYRTHVQIHGWQKVFSDGEIAGTTGESKRMEAIQIMLNGVDGVLTYQVHVQDHGWMKPVSEGEIAGTTGESRRMEAIIINLKNSSYVIKYRVHTQDHGWMAWVQGGEIAGTTGESRRLEAIQIKVEKKDNHEIIVEKEISLENEINIPESVEIKENQIYSGIDVSKYQGEIDWNMVKQSGIDFAMIRCGYRGYTSGGLNEDPTFVSNVKGAYASGIKVGLYFYSSAISEQEAIEEANFVLNLLKKYGIQDEIAYPIAFDIEDFEGTRNYLLTVQQRTNIVKVFCDVIESNGFQPMVYSYTYFLDSKLDMDQLKNYDTWIADYYENTWYKRDYTIWQYTDKGVVNGISGNVDMNYAYREY